MRDIYAAPQAELVQPPSTGEYGSMARALSGEYDCNVGEIVSEAWAKTSGAKGTINLALSLYVIVVVALTAAMAWGFSLWGASFGGDMAKNGFLALLGFEIVKTILVNIVALPIFLGVFLIGARRAVGAPISAMRIFGHFDKAVPLVLTMVLMYIMTIIGFIALIIPGIYLSVAYVLAFALVVEKNLSPWQALETSRKAIGKQWFSVFGLGVLVMLINFLGIIPFGIGLIWTVPMSLIAYGILYRNIFGLEALTLAN